MIPLHILAGVLGSSNAPIVAPFEVDSLSGFGDSITVGINSSNNNNRWLNLVSNIVNKGTLRNQAISGTVLQNSNGSGGVPLDDNGRDRYLTALTGVNKTDGVIIAYGYNDARYVAAPSTFNAAEYKNDYLEIVDGLLANGYSADKIVIVSPYRITDTGLLTGSAGFNGQTRAGYELYVTAAQEVASEKGLKYVDVYNQQTTICEDNLVSGGDIIHPVDIGHAYIADRILAVLRPDRTPSLSASSSGDNTVEYEITPPSIDLEVASYTVQYGVYGHFNFDQNTQDVTSLSGILTGVNYPNTRIRVRANFSDSTVGNWVYSESITVNGCPVNQLVDNFEEEQGSMTLAAHTPDYGYGWTYMVGQSANSFLFDNNNAIYSTNNSCIWYNKTPPPDDDYFVETDLVVLTTPTNNVGIFIKGSPVSQTFYFARMNTGSGGSVDLFRTVNNVSTQIGTAPQAFTSGTATLRLEVRGTQLSVLFNGNLKIQVTDNSIKSRGYGGIRNNAVSNLNSGTHYSAFRMGSLEN